MIHLEFARDRSISPRYIFVGRLVFEKGFDLVIQVAKAFLSHEGNSGLIEIYGSGPLRQQMILELQRFPGFFDASQGRSIPPGAQVVYFGQVSGNRVTEALSRSHYMLMPSRFLETFGLSALEAIESGVPVIGFHQGGLSQFLLSEHRVMVGATQDTAFLQTIIEVDSAFSGANWRRQSLSVQDIAKKYGTSQWVSEVQKYLPTPCKKILIISDYSAPIGGIETHIQGSIGVLRAAGYEIQTVFAMKGENRFIRYLGLLFSSLNIWFALRLWWKIHQYHPDVIWVHSEVRCIGPIGLLPLLKFSGSIMKTYHDLGYFGAFPTQFTSETQLNPGLHFAQFFQRSKGRHRYFLFHIFAKFCQIQAIRGIIGARGIHIVPSEFMIPAVQGFTTSEAKVVKISHFSPHHP